MISFGGEGKVQARKRVRGKIGNHRKYPEIKMHNLFVSTEDTPNTYYTHKSINGVFHDVDDDHVWMPIPTHWPTQGASQFQRIGRKIRVKFLRIKGYVHFSPFLIQQVRYRIVLYRCKYVPPEDMTHVWLKSFYNYFTDMENEDLDIFTIAAGASDNFYMSYFDNERLKELDCKRRVIHKGLIKPQFQPQSFVVPQHNISSTVGVGNQVKVTALSQGFIHGVIFSNGSASGNFNGGADPVDNENHQLNTSFNFNALPITTNVQQHDALGRMQPHLPYDEWGRIYANTSANQRGFFPIDITIDMNDSVDTLEYMYFFVIESDVAIGQTPAGVFGYDDDKYSNWGLFFLPQIFYTDD